MRRRLVAAVLMAPLALGACGSTSPTPSATHTMADGRVMSGASMSGMDMGGGSEGRGAGAVAPTDTAAMICGAEIRAVVGRTLQSHAPRGLHSWSHRLYRCSYLVPGGELQLSVKDLDMTAPGRAYFDRVRRSIPGVSAIRGLENLGFPAFESPRGEVAFIKDHKTLLVNAGRLAASSLPAGMSREDVAYAVAAAVIACWKE